MDKWLIDLLNDWLIDRSIDFVNMNHRCIRIYTWSCQFKGDYVKLGQPVAYPTRLWSVRSGGGLFGQVLVYSARRLSVQLSRAENVTSDFDTSWPDSRATRLSGQHRVRNPVLPPPPHPQPPPPASTPPSTESQPPIQNTSQLMSGQGHRRIDLFLPYGVLRNKVF